MRYNIACIYTTFLRDELMKKTLTSIQNTNPDLMVLIGDQDPTSLKKITYHNDNIFYGALPFDCGLSYARNFIIRQCPQLGVRYFIMTADSIEFTEKYDFYSIIDLMQQNKIDKMGFTLNNRIKWEFDMELHKDSFYLKRPTRKIGEFTQVDTCKNFFIASVDSFLDVPYDNNLSLCEHEDHSWRYKQAGYITCVTNSITANYIDSKPTLYNEYRKRMYKEFQKVLQKKYNLTGWIDYEPGLFHEK